MAWLDLTRQPLAMNIGIFAACTVVVWLAGWRMSQYADRFASAAGLGHAMVGLVVLAGLTSLPEVAVTASSALAGAPQLAVNNLVGGIAMQIALLAAADALIGRQALTVVAGNAMILLQATMTVLLLVLLALALAIGDRPFAGGGFWTWGLALAYVMAMRTVAKSGGREVWVTRRGEGDQREGQAAQAPPPSGDEPVPPLLAKLALCGGIILVAGFVLSRTADAVADQSGLGTSFVGAVFLAVATSLPEASTVVSSMRRRRYELALSNIFGTGMFNVLLVFPVDLLYAGAPALNELGPFSLVASLLGALLAAIFLVGLIERRDRTVLRMGVDSLAVLVCYFAGLAVLYQLR